MTVENSVSKTPKLVMGAKTYDFNFDVLLEDPTTEDAKRAIKCAISDGTTETELIYGTDYTVTLNSDKKGGVVTVTDTKNSDWHIVIYRQYNMTQGVDLNDYNEFPAETIERAFDKQTMLIQELKEIAERSVKVTPANNQTPEELLDEVYSKLDSATEVATNAIAAATLATTAAESATKAVEEAEQQVAEVTKYIDDKKVEIDGIVVDAQNSVDGAIQQAVEDVKQAAVNEAESVIQDAGQTATNIAVDYVNTSVKPELQGISDNAQQYATNAKASQEAAKVSETNAKASETASKQSETNAKVSETNAKNYANSVNPENLLNTKMITNCLTHIPQDIKLELVDGRSALKAGSKVWIPYGTTEVYQVGDIDAQGNIVVATSWDGSKFFYAIELQRDLTDNSPGGSPALVFVKEDLSGIIIENVSESVSGSSDSLSGVEWHTWLDTTNNKVKRYAENGAFETNLSLPVGVVIRGSTITSIDKTFNGFGYIGSTVFALPGVRGLIPDDRNADGTLNSVPVIIQSVQLTERADTFNQAFLVVKNDGTLGVYEGNFYNEEENYNRSGAGSIQNVCRVGTLTLTSGVISNFNPKNTFQAVDRNDSTWLSGLGMPSNKYIDLTLGASDSTYIAPANGLFLLNKSTAGSSYQYINIYINGVVRDKTVATAAHENVVSASVKKGDIAKVSYVAGGSTNLFRFYYAEGETE